MRDLELEQHEQIWGLYEFLLTHFAHDFFTAKDLTAVCQLEKKQLNRILHRLMQLRVVKAEKDTFGCNHYRLL